MLRTPKIECHVESDGELVYMAMSPAVAHCMHYLTGQVGGIGESTTREATDLVWEVLSPILRPRPHSHVRKMFEIDGDVIRGLSWQSTSVQQALSSPIAVTITEEIDDDS